MGVKSLIENWKKKRTERAEEQKRINDLFERFLLETKPLTPKASKHPQAALYRHAWKRSVALILLFKDSKNPESEILYKKFADIAAKRYDEIAPDGPYGKVRLKMTPEAVPKLMKKEAQNISTNIPRATLPEKIDKLI
jgi:hypothetical protein